MQSHPEVLGVRAPTRGFGGDAVQPGTGRLEAEPRDVAPPQSG